MTTGSTRSRSFTFFKDWICILYNEWMVEVGLARLDQFTHECVLENNEALKKNKQYKEWMLLACIL